MIVKSNSLLCRVLCRIASPTQYLPPLFWVMACRVGQDCQTYCRVTLRRP